MEKIWVECGRDGCTSSSQVAFDTDAGNARFQMEVGWACLPVVGVRTPKGEGDQWWFVCPVHRAQAEFYLKEFLANQRRAAMIEAAKAYVATSADVIAPPPGVGP